MVRMMMRGSIVGGLGALFLLASAANVCAATMLVQLDGDFNDDPKYLGWTATLIYDTDLATEVTLPFGGHELHWQAGDGPSPIISFAGTVFGRSEPHPLYPVYQGPFPVPDIHFSVQDFSDFAFLQGPGGFEVDVNGTIHLGYYSDFFQFGGYGPAIPFSTPHYFGFSAFGLPNGWTVGDTGLPYLETVNVSRLDIPEPSSWALMLLGFVSLGAALRLQRRQPALSNA